MTTLNKVTCTLINTEYPLTIPLACRVLAFKVRGGIGANTVRYSWTTGVVAAPNEAGGTYHSLDTNTPTYANEHLNFQHLSTAPVLYFASNHAGDVLEVEITV